MNNEFFPCVFNLYKPAGESSQDILRSFKRTLPKGFGKIGHFGTLDPFAEGVLMVGISGAARMNEYIHNFLPKTYLAKGLLGIETPTGDLTVEANQKDESDYLKTVIADMDKTFLEQKFSSLVGEYWQSPPAYSAAKYQGKKLHQWAREGVEIKKEAKKRFIYSLEVVDYNFPEVTFRVKSSSGTYIRTLFSDMAQILGTLGCLKTLKREAVGDVAAFQSVTQERWKQEGWDWRQDALQPYQVLPFPVIEVPEGQKKRYRNGASIDLEAQKEEGHFWVELDGRIWGLGLFSQGVLSPEFNFPLPS